MEFVLHANQLQATFFVQLLHNLLLLQSETFFSNFLSVTCILMHSGYFLFVTTFHLRNILLKAPVILMELFSAKLVTPEFSSEPSSQVVTLNLTSTQLFV